MDEYTVSVISEQRLREMRAEAECYRLAHAGLARRRSLRPLRVIVAAALTALGLAHRQPRRRARASFRKGQTTIASAMRSTTALTGRLTNTVRSFW
jgi:hypothetical protein